MIYHFPPAFPDANDNSFLAIENTVFAKFKKEGSAAVKNIFLTENVLVLVLKGYKHLYIGEQTVEVTAHDVIFLKKGIYAMAEYFEGAEGFEAVLLFLNPKLLQEIAAEHGLKSSGNALEASYLKIRSNAAIDSYKSQMAQYFTDQSLHDKSILLLKQKEILLYILKTVPYPQTAPFWDSVMPASSENLTGIINRHLFENLSLKEYADLSNRSLSSFKRDFSQAYGLPPKKWINQKKLEYSCLLLKNTQERISDISEKCGFESLSYFTQTFRKAFHKTPSEFRADI